MRFYPFFILFTLASCAVFAQVSPPVLRANSLATATPAQPAADTVAAIHKLFAKRRRQQTLGALGIVVGTAVAVTAVGSTRSASNTAYLSAVGIGFLAIPVLVVELLHFDRYNRKRERQAVSAFGTHHLPKWLRRELKPKFFR